MIDTHAPAVPPPPRIGEVERLRATIVLSVLVHAMVILGIGIGAARRVRSKQLYPERPSGGAGAGADQ